MYMLKRKVFEALSSSGCLTSLKSNASLPLFSRITFSGTRSL